MFAGHGRIQGMLWQQLTMHTMIETFCYFLWDSASWSRKLEEAYLAKIIDGSFLVLSLLIVMGFNKWKATS